jgi:hypothetical protein
MPKINRLLCVHFEIVRECEKDMRVLARDMKRRRILWDAIAKMGDAREKGEPVDEVEFTRLRRKKSQLNIEIPKRWERLYARMGKEKSKREALQRTGTTKRRTADGYRAHPQAHGIRELDREAQRCGQGP